MRRTATVKTRVERPGAFGMVPREVILDPKVSARAVRFFAYLMALDKDADGFVRMEQAEVVGAFGSYSTIRGCTRELKAAGHVEVEYDRKGHLTTYKMLWGVLRAEHKGHRQPASAARAVEGGHRQLASDGTASPLAGAHIADNTQTTSKASPARDRKDPRRARAFLERFAAWYERVYGRPHSSPDRGQIFATDALLRRVDRDLLRVPAVNEASAESVVGCVLTVSLRSKAQIWFLRNGEPLCLDEILSTKKWQVLWDRFLEDGQRQGYPMGAFDGRDEGNRQSAA